MLLEDIQAKCRNLRSEADKLSNSGIMPIDRTQVAYDETWEIQRKVERYLYTEESFQKPGADHLVSSGQELPDGSSSATLPQISEMIHHYTELSKIKERLNWDLSKGKLFHSETEKKFGKLQKKLESLEQTDPSEYPKEIRYQVEKWLGRAEKYINYRQDDGLKRSFNDKQVEEFNEEIADLNNEVKTKASLTHFDKLKNILEKLNQGAEAFHSERIIKLEINKADAWSNALEDRLHNDLLPEQIKQSDLWLTYERINSKYKKALDENSSVDRYKKCNEEFEQIGQRVREAYIDSVVSDLSFEANFDDLGKKRELFSMKFKKALRKL